MTNRENGLAELYERLKLVHAELGITTFRRTPTVPATEEEMPCVFMTSGRDNIIEHSKRSKTGYPARRALEVIFDIIVQKDVDIETLFLNIRRALFTERGSDPVVYNPVVYQNTFINENRTEGPTGYGSPDTVGMSLVLDLVYTDNGF